VDEVRRCVCRVRRTVLEETGKDGLGERGGRGFGIWEDWGGGVGVGGAMESVNLIQFFFFALSESGRVCVKVS